MQDRLLQLVAAVVGELRASPAAGPGIVSYLVIIRCLAVVISVGSVIVSRATVGPAAQEPRTNIAARQTSAHWEHPAQPGSDLPSNIVPLVCI